MAGRQAGWLALGKEEDLPRFFIEAGFLACAHFHRLIPSRPSAMYLPYFFARKLFFSLLNVLPSRSLANNRVCGSVRCNEPLLRLFAQPFAAPKLLGLLNTLKSSRPLGAICKYSTCMV